MARRPDDRECQAAKPSVTDETTTDQTRSFIPKERAGEDGPSADTGATRYLPNVSAVGPPNGAGDSSGHTDPEATNYQPVRADRTTGFVPHQLGEYELLEEVARGGMGVVFKARQATLDRTVALKMILAGRFAGSGALDRFRLEARAAAALNHPCIVPIYDIGEFEGQPFFTMAFVTGGSLQQVLASGPLAPLTAARLLQRVAEAVQCAHDKGIIHRDLKPQNILLQQDESLHAFEGGSGVRMAGAAGASWSTAIPMLTDFGLARAASEGSGMTRTGEAMGTPSFMPPEQALGDLKSIGPCSDIYSLGAVLYCMLTGRPPFQAGDAHLTMKQVLEDEPVPPRKLNPKVPRDLETICLKCLAKEPNLRYASAALLVEDIGCVLNDQPLRHARRVGPVTRAFVRSSRAVRRHPLWWALGALSLAAFVWLGLVVLQTARDRQEAFARTLQEAETSVRAAEMEQNRSAALNRYTQAQGHYEELLRQRPDPRFQRALADVYIHKGALLRQMRDLDQAEAELTRARDELTALLRTQPDDKEGRLKLAEVFHTLGIVYDARVNRTAQLRALDFYKESLQIREALCQSDPGQREFRRDLARSWGYMADTQLSLGRHAEAKRSYDEAEAIRQALAEQGGEGSLEAKYQFARSLGNTGNYLDWTEARPDKAIEAHRIRKRYVESLAGPEVPPDFKTDLADSKIDIARLQLDDLAKYGDEPRSLLLEALTFYEAMLKDNPTDRGFLSSLATIHVQLAKYYVLKGDLKQAGIHVERAFDTFEKGRLNEASDLYTRSLAEALVRKLPASERAYGPRQVLGDLERATKKGFRNVLGLKRDVGFSEFHNSPKFHEIVRFIEAECAAAAPDQ
ncbi:MAG: serine/threonine-protein kinase [Gemmataceae bacterium]|nr:serine/threonine-protein kinase [Gemmataceae bacterium]